MAYGVRDGYGVLPTYGVRANYGILPEYGTLWDQSITDFDVDAAESFVTLSGSTVEEGDTLTLTIVARNAAGQALADKPITSVTITPTGAATVSGSGNTNGSGTASRTLTAGDVGTGNTVTVVCDGVTLDDVPSFDVTAAPPPEAGLFVDNLFVSGLFVPGLFVEA